MLNFSVWVDADSFPKKARNYILESAASKSVKVIFVSNNSIDSGSASLVVCSNEHDAADNYIYEHVLSNDIVVTRDILFAARLVEKKTCVMNDRGVIFTQDNIKDKIREREFSLNLSDIGLGGSKANYYSEKELKKFSRTFIEELQKHIIADIYGCRSN